jgi:hypothetical protein
VACANRGMDIDERLAHLLSETSLDELLDVVERMHPKRVDFFLAAHIASAGDNRGWD